MNANTRLAWLAAGIFLVVVLLSTAPRFGGWILLIVTVSLLLRYESRGAK